MRISDWSSDVCSSDLGDPAAAIIILDIRLPRIVAAAVVGAALGLCGAALQALTRNPLAEPGILGVSAAATLGATLTLYFGLAAVWSWALPLGAIGGALLVTALLASAAVRTQGMASLILIGVGLSQSEEHTSELQSLMRISY